MKKLLNLLIIFCLFCFPLFAQEEEEVVTAKASFDKAEITIGEKVKFFITLEAPKDTEFDFPLVDSILTNVGFAVKDFDEEKPVRLSKNRYRTRRWYLLDTYITGAYEVPDIIIHYTLADGTTGEVETRQVFLDVKSVIAEGEKADDIRDIKAPVFIPVNYAKLIIWTIIILIVIIIIAVGIPLYFKYRHIIMPPPPPTPAHVIALRALEKIKGLSLETEEQIKKYYIGVSGIVRHYIESRFFLNAPEQTTEEFLAALANSDSFNNKHKTLLRNFLKHCDMVKFAKYGPTKEEIDDVYNTGKEFVKETIPQDKTEEKVKQYAV